MEFQFIRYVWRFCPSVAPPAPFPYFPVPLLVLLIVHSKSWAARSCPPKCCHCHMSPSTGQLYCFPSMFNFRSRTRPRRRTTRRLACHTFPSHPGPVPLGVVSPPAVDMCGAGDTLLERSPLSIHVPPLSLSLSLSLSVTGPGTMNVIR